MVFVAPRSVRLIPNEPDELPRPVQAIGLPDGAPQGVGLPLTVQVPIGAIGKAQSLMAPSNAISCGVQERVSTGGPDALGVAGEPGTGCPGPCTPTSHRASPREAPSR